MNFGVSASAYRPPKASSGSNWNCPGGALHGAGATTEIISLHPGEIQARQFDMASAGSFPVHPVVTDVSAALRNLH